jgi:feruloyl esterase
MKLLADRVVQQCDALDGLKDGMIFNPEACHFDPKVLQCSGEKDASCLTAAQVETIKKVFGGPHDSHGKAIYSNWPYDAGDDAMGWRVWMLGMGQMPAINVLIFPSFFNGLALAGSPPPIDIFRFNFDTDPARIDKASAEINATSLDWSAFHKHGGKLLLYNGMSDPVFSAFDLIRYYKQIEEHNGGEARTEEFARLFLVPGMNHCGGGPALDDFDSLTALQEWVEEGKAPQSMISSGQAFPGRTRPLCAYPQIAIYDGKGNPEDAASFSCQKPKE